MRYIKLIALILLTCVFGWANNFTFEVRTAGSDLNAGGFQNNGTGTDYSQQNSAQYSFTDLASSNGTSTPCIVTSASHSFVAADVGNWIHILSGTNWGPTPYHIIISVSGGAATLDSIAACGSAATLSGGTWREGGAFATIANANTVEATYGAGNTVYVKADGTYTVTTAMIVNGGNANNNNQSSTFIGYTSSRGDNGRVTWTTATNSVDLIDFESASGYIFKNFNFTTSAGTVAAGAQAIATGGNLTTASIWFDNCKWTGFTYAILGNWNVNQSFNGLAITNSEITTSTTDAILNSGGVTLIGDYIHGNTGDGFQMGPGSSLTARGPIVVINSIIYNNTGNGITNNTFGGYSSNAQPNLWTMVWNSDISTNTGDGIHLGAGKGQVLMVYNNIFDANGGYGINCTNFCQATASTANAFYSNTSGQIINITVLGSVTLTGSPYTSIGSNFALNNTSGAGASCRNAGFPGILNAGGTGYNDIGALRHQDPAGTGGQHAYPIL